MPHHLVMPPAPHATDSAAWEWVHGDAPQTSQRTPGVPPATAGQTSVVLIVPASALSWHRVTLPPGLLGRDGQARQALRLRAVLESLLEDQLLDDPAQLHFALQARSADAGPWWVAVCQRAWLQGAVDAVRQAGHGLDGIVPEWAPGDSATPETLWMTGEPEDAVWTWFDADGVHQRHRGNPPPAPISNAFAEPACAELAEQLLHREVVVQHRADRLRAAASAPWSLAQGEFTSRSHWTARATDTAKALWQAPAWRPARWALALLAVVQLVGLNAQAWQARQALKEQRSALHDILLRTFPATTVVVDAPLQMQRAVDALGQTGGQTQARDLERLLESFGALAPANSEPQAIEFIAGELRITPPRGQDTPPDTLRDSLQSRGYRLRTEGTVWVLSP